MWLSTRLSVLSPVCNMGNIVCYCTQTHDKKSTWTKKIVYVASCVDMIGVHNFEKKKFMNYLIVVVVMIFVLVVWWLHPKMGEGLANVAHFNKSNIHDDKFCYEAVLWLDWIFLRWGEVMNVCVFVLTRIRSNWQHSEEWNYFLSCSRHWILGSEICLMFLKIF